MQHKNIYLDRGPLNFYKRPKRIYGLRSYLLVLALIFIAGCKKYISVDAPVTSINAGNIYSNDATAASVLTGLYTKLSNDNITSFSNGDLTSVSLFLGLAADELVLYDINNQKYSSYYKNALSSAPPSATADYWKTIYPVIFITNSAIDGLNNSTTLTVAVKQQLLGEAKFVRAFCYFYLVNLFGEIPLAITTDWQLNTSLLRTPKTNVYQQIISDLKDAQQLLSDNYLKGDALTSYSLGSEERVRPTKWAATALLARSYLYIGDYTNAELQATNIINNSSLFSLQIPLTDVFKKNSKEAIWELQSVGTGLNSNTGEGKFFILPNGGPNVSYPVYLNNNLIKSFEPGDQRLVYWVDSVKPGTIAYYFPKKYKIGATNTNSQEYSVILRLAELYLIRAETEANGAGSGPSGAVADLNKIRSRAGVGNYVGASDKASLLAAILHERQVELFTEWGHRWFDLKRTGNIDATMSIITPMKGGTWIPYKALLPIPLSELQKAPQLVQNSGY